MRRAVGKVLVDECASARGSVPRARMLPVPATGTSPVPRGRVEIIDYLRLIAAVSVMGFHYLYNGIENGKIGSITRQHHA